ncbi:MAG: class I mannose-6-phosphate isomerase [Bacteroidales bacterium]|nr:class I mannose-6-phosphate isomerase [Bacteroidales bacterium]
MNSLYPLKFTPIISDKIWGGSKLKNILNKKEAGNKAGESWEISSVEGNISVVSEGFLKGNNIQELIGIYMGDLVGDKTFEKFGTQFPLLVKFIDANDDLSIQVHPDDNTALKRHNSYGKTEMWYVVQADNGTKLISSFKPGIGQDEYLHHLKNNSLEEILNEEKTKEGDVFFIPAGRVHAIGAGIIIAEVQQTSDITYRIYDFNRKDKNGNTRELHTDLAIDVIDFKTYSDYSTPYEKKSNKTVDLVSCQYFTTNLIWFDRAVEKDYNFIDSFVIYMCISGKVLIKYSETEEITLNYGETVLIPAEIKKLELIPINESRLLEIYIRED